MDEEIYDRQRLLYGKLPSYVTGLFFFAVVMVFTLFLFVAFVRLDATIWSEGILRQEGETVSLKSIGTGYLKKIFVNNGTYVRQGDTIALIADPVLETRILFSHRELIRTGATLEAIDRLLEDSSRRYKCKPSSADWEYSEKMEALQAGISQWEHRIQQLRKQFNVTSALHRQGVVPVAERENQEFALQQAILEEKRFYQEQLAEWRKERRQVFNQWVSLKQQLSVWEVERNTFWLLAPVDGTVHGLNYRYREELLVKGEVFCQLYPDSKLVAECYVAPTYMPFIKPGQVVRLHPSGNALLASKTLDGYVTGIDHVPTLVDKAVFYKVRCSIAMEANPGDIPSLQLVSGIHLQMYMRISSQRIWQWLLTGWKQQLAKDKFSIKF